MSEKIKPSMLLVTAELKSGDSFRLIPMSKDCPFSEGIYDMGNKVFCVFAQNAKDSLHLVPKLDNHGDITRAKRERLNGKTYQEERVQMETFVEHYISVQEEIEQFIDMVAINANTFDYKKYLKAEPKPDFYVGDAPKEDTGNEPEDKPAEK